MSTETLPVPIVEQVVETEKPATWSLVCHNDEVHPFELVMIALAAIGLDGKTAYEKTREIHFQGSAIVKGGLTRQQAIDDREIIIAITKNGQAFPGIEVSFLEEV